MSLCQNVVFLVVVLIRRPKKKICVQNIFLSYLKLFSKCWRDRYDRMEKYYLLKTFFIKKFVYILQLLKRLKRDLMIEALENHLCSEINP